MAGVLIPQNLVTPPLYKASHFVLDGGCDDGIDHAAGWCPSCPQSRDTAPLLGLIFVLDGGCDDGTDHAAGGCARHLPLLHLHGLLHLSHAGWHHPSASR
jgi:hypothetical protein